MIQSGAGVFGYCFWIPACAGMTGVKLEKLERCKRCEKETTTAFYRASFAGGELDYPSG